MNTSIRPHRAFVFVVLLVLVLAACGQSNTGGAPSSAATSAAPAAATAAPATGATGTIKIATKDFAEEYILGEMYAQLLENAGFTVERAGDKKIPVLGETPVLHAAIVKGDLDIYPEYTSTGLLVVLKKEQIKDPKQIFDTVKSEYEKQFKLTWLEASPFNDTQALATTKANSDKYGIKTYSDLAPKASQLRLGAAAAYLERPDGIKGLQQAYGGFQFKEIKQLGTGVLRYDALKNGDIDVVEAFGTDGRIKGDNLVLLKDDKNFYPIYQAAPVIRMDTLQKYPQIADILNKLAPLLTDEVMAGLNYQVDGPDKVEPAAVAKAFLQQQGLLKK